VAVVVVIFAALIAVLLFHPQTLATPFHRLIYCMWAGRGEKGFGLTVMRFHLLGSIFNQYSSQPLVFSDGTHVEKVCLFVSFPTDFPLTFFFLKMIVAQNMMKRILVDYLDGVTPDGSTIIDVNVSVSMCFEHSIMCHVWLFAHDQMRDGYVNPVRVFTPKRVKENPHLKVPVIMFIHGGGFCTGCVSFDIEILRWILTVMFIRAYNQADRFLLGILDKVNAIIFSIDYRFESSAFISWVNLTLINGRLAPQYPHPFAVHDTTDHFHWIRENADKYNGDINRFAGRDYSPHSNASDCWILFSVFGESAGGNLAAVISILCRDWKSEPPIKLQILHAPGLETDIGKYSSHKWALMILILVVLSEWRYFPQRIGKWWFRADLGAHDWILSKLRRDGRSRGTPVTRAPQCGDRDVKFQTRDPTIAPMQASTLSSLPKTLMIVCEQDPLRDESKRGADTASLSPRHSQISFQVMRTPNDCGWRGMTSMCSLLRQFI
jgi:acetyl esterase/lipase